MRTIQKTMIGFSILKNMFAHQNVKLKENANIFFLLPAEEETHTFKITIIWKYTSKDTMIVPHWLRLNVWIIHHDIEVATSNKPIGEILKYMLL